MKRLKMLLCLTAMTVGLTATQLQAKAAEEKLETKMTKPEVVQQVETQSSENVNQNDKDVKITNLTEAQIANIGAKTASSSGYYFYNTQSYTLSQPGLIHVYGNMEESVGIYNVATGKYYLAYMENADGKYKATVTVNPGTYRILIGGYDWEQGLRFTSITTEIPTFMPTKNTTITRDDCLDATSSYYIKVKANKTGVITIKPLLYGMELTLLNASKKALTDEIYSYSGGSSSFGIKKGATYYIKVTSSLRAKYSMNFTSINEKSGSKRTKAAKLSKKNKWYSGTILAGSGTADWYKINVNKRSKLNIYIKPQISGSIKISVYRPNGKAIGRANTITSYYNGSTLIDQIYGLGGDGKISEGTYFVKIVRGTKYTTGSYSLKWKLK